MPLAIDTPMVGDAKSDRLQGIVNQSFHIAVETTIGKHHTAHLLGWHCRLEQFIRVVVDEQSLFVIQVLEGVE